MQMAGRKEKLMRTKSESLSLKVIKGALKRKNWILVMTRLILKQVTIMKMGYVKVYPYYFTYVTHAKGRWVGRNITDVFTKEFRLMGPGELNQHIMGWWYYC